MKDLSSVTPSTLSGDVAPDYEHRDLNLHIANSHLLRGIQLHRRTLAFSDENVSVVREGCRVSTHEDNTTDTEVLQVATEAESKWVHLGLSKQAARLCASWSSSSESNADAGPPHAVPQVFVTARQIFSRVTIRTNLVDLDPDPVFVAAISDAIEKPSEDAQADALRSSLDKWGHAIPTWIELGCAIVGTVDLPADRKDLQDAIQAALQAKVGGFPGEILEDKKNLALEVASKLRTRVMGGFSTVINSPESYNEWLLHVNNDSQWTVIAVDGVYRTIDLLRRSHPYLYSSAVEILGRTAAVTISPALRPAASSVTGSPIPIYHFAGRLIAYQHQPTDWLRMSGFIESDIEGLDLTAEYSISCWVLSGAQSGNHNDTFLSIESPEYDGHLLHLCKPSPTAGNFTGHFVARVYHPDFITLSTHKKALGLSGLWYHVAIVKTHRMYMLYVDGTEVDQQTIPTGSSPSKAQWPRLCIGRGAWAGQRCDQWDGGIADVRVFGQALSKADIAASARIENRTAFANDPVGESNYPPRF